MVEVMSASHPMLRWAERNRISIGELAVMAGCTQGHLSNVFCGRRGVSLELAKRLSEVSGGKVKMDAFLRTECRT
jgi:plasmid maintenance system antidote protein VapI